MPTPHDVTLRALDLALPGNRTLRLMLSMDAAGQPEDLAIVAGFAPLSLHDLSRGVTVPASCLPALRDALAALQPAA